MDMDDYSSFFLVASAQVDGRKWSSQEVRQQVRGVVKTKRFCFFSTWRNVGQQQHQQSTIFVLLFEGFLPSGNW